MSEELSTKLVSIVCESLSAESANVLPAICEGYGLAGGTIPEAYKSKYNYVYSRVAHMTEKEILGLAEMLKGKYPGCELDQLLESRVDLGGIIELERRIQEIKALMIAYSTDGRTEDQPHQYHEAYIDLHYLIEKNHLINPNRYKTIEQFWHACPSTWAERRHLVGEIYADLLLDIGRKKRSFKNPRNWASANNALTDNLESVRNQWSKAKNFIFSSPPDYENSIKESVNSIESCLKILLKQPNGTLGKMIKSSEFNSDVGQTISKVYGLSSNMDFVRHGGVESQKIGRLEAEFFLEFAASSIIYIKKSVCYQADNEK